LTAVKESPPVTESVPVAGVHWNFQGSLPASMIKVGNGASDNLQHVTDGLRCVHPAKFDQGYESLGVKWKGELVGDFEITMNYHDFQSKPVLLDWRVPRVDVSLAIFEETNSQVPINLLGLAHRREVDGRVEIIGTLGTRRPDGTFDYATNGAKTELSDSGRLRITRKDSTLSFLAASLDSEDWKLCGSRSVDPATVRSVTFGLRCEDQDASAEVILTEMMIRADEIRAK
jgi:hypothetical protein